VTDVDYAKFIKKWDDFQVEDSAEVCKTITEADVIIWCGLVGDFNPMHLDRVYGKTTRFEDVIAPGAFVSGMISAAITKVCFGQIYLNQEVKFKKPVYLGDTITACATIIEKVDARHAVKLETKALNQYGDVVVEGVGMEYILKD
jgi:3-hydroxybutyryl-CoA dehydratase